MEDGASAHRAKYTKAHRDYYQMPSLVWPPSPPDLNPTENIWFLLKSRIEKRENVTEEEILPFVDSIPGRIKAFIEAEGSHTRW